MRSFAFFGVMALVGCSVSAESAVPATSADGVVLVGSRPAEALGLPEFAVADQLGHERTGADLLGHPQVLWFYPMAGTPG